MAITFLHLAIAWLIFLVMFLSITCVLLFRLYRNEWVYGKRIELIVCRDFDKYNKLKSYSWMTNHWWIWDIEKCLKPEVKKPELKLVKGGR